MHTDENSQQVTDKALIQLVLDSRSRYIVAIEDIASSHSLQTLEENELKKIAEEYTVGLSAQFITPESSKKTLLEAKLAISSLTFKIHNFNCGTLADGKKDSVLHMRELIKQLSVSEKRLLKDFIINLYDALASMEAAIDEGQYKIRTGRVISDKAYLVILVAEACLKDTDSPISDSEHLIKDCCDTVKKLPFSDISEAKMHCTSMFGMSYIGSYMTALKYLKHLSKNDPSIDIAQLAYEGEEACLIYGLELYKDGIYNLLGVERATLHSEALKVLAELRLQCKVAQGQALWKNEVQDPAAIIANGYTRRSLREIEEQAAVAPGYTRWLLSQFNRARENAIVAAPYLGAVVVAGVGVMLGSLLADSITTQAYRNEYNRSSKPL